MMIADAPPLLHAERVSRSYDAGRIQALTDVTLTIRRGDSLAILGPSGSGKSTLLNLLCGLDRPSEGAISVDGQLPSTARAWARVRARRIGIVFQAFNLLPTLTACENVEVPMFGVTSGARTRRQRALALLQEVGLAHRARHRPVELSGGERQRVAVARSLANDPDLLLADEPTGSLDTQSAATVLALLLAVQQKRQMALVLVTHDERLAASAGRRLTMLDGGIVEH